jgi:hypothetical protein
MSEVLVLETERIVKRVSIKAAGNAATEAYPLGYVAGSRATENEAGGDFHDPMIS